MFLDISSSSSINNSEYSVSYEVSCDGHCLSVQPMIKVCYIRLRPSMIHPLCIRLKESFR